MCTQAKPVHIKNRRGPEGDGLAIERCVFCGYSLKGLMYPCKCPECGTRYDHRSAIWFAFAFPEHLTYLLPSTFLMLMGIQLTQRFGAHQLVPFIIIVYVLFVPITFGRWLVGYYRLRRRPYIAFLPDSIVISSRVRKTRLRRIVYARIQQLLQDKSWTARRYLERSINWSFLLFTPMQLQEMERALRNRLGSDSKSKAVPSN